MIRVQNPYWYVLSPMSVLFAFFLGISVGLMVGYKSNWMLIPTIILISCFAYVILSDEKTARGLMRK